MNEKTQGELKVAAIPKYGKRLTKDRKYSIPTGRSHD
jgi:hypothetical protein